MHTEHIETHKPIFCAGWALSRRTWDRIFSSYYWFRCMWRGIFRCLLEPLYGSYWNMLGIKIKCFTQYYEIISILETEIPSQCHCPFLGPPLNTCRRAQLRNKHEKHDRDGWEASWREKKYWMQQIHRSHETHKPWTAGRYSIKRLHCL